MTERDDKVLQDATADLAHTSFYESKEWLRQQARENRSADGVFPTKSGDDVRQLESLRDAISFFCDAHLATFERISQNITQFENGLHTFPGGTEEACKLCDPALLTFLKALRGKLLRILGNPRDFQRDVEIQRETPGTELKILSQRTKAALQQSIAKIEESLRNSATGTSAQQSIPDWLYRDLESIYQGHRADNKSVVDSIKRLCPAHIVETVKVLNLFMASEAKALSLGNSERIHELFIRPLSNLSAELGALDFAMERLDSLNTAAKCIRAGGEEAKLATIHLITEKLRISMDPTKPRIESR